MRMPLVVCAIALLLPPVASAQTQAPQPTPSNAPAPPEVRRPFRGLIGAPADPLAKRQSLDLTFSGFEAYDDNTVTDSEGNPFPQQGYLKSGWYTGATAGLAYNRPGDRLSIGLTGNAAVNRYLSIDRTTTMYQAGGDLSSQLTRHTTATLDGTFSYAPRFRLGLASGGNFSTDLNAFNSISPDFDLFDAHAYRSNARASLSQEFGGRITVMGFYGLTNVNYTNNGTDFRSMRAGVRFSQQMSQHLGYHLGYSMITATSPLLNLSGRRIHNIDAGVDYGRALSFSRRTTLTFSTGSAVVSAYDQFTTTAASNKLRYRFTGDASLDHELGRTWTASLGYRRAVNWREGFGAPLLSDGINAAFGGYLSRRAKFSSAADLTLGSVGFGSNNNRYNSGSAQADLEYALSHTLALFGRYVYYRYHFDAGALIDPRIVPSLERQGASVGLEASFPVVR